LWVFIECEGKNNTTVIIYLDIYLYKINGIKVDIDFVIINHKNVKYILGCYTCEQWKLKGWVDKGVKWHFFKNGYNYMGESFRIYYTF
jgi:hypothetical protein